MSLLINPRKPVGTVAYIGTNTVPEPFCWSMIQLVQFCNEFICTEPGEYIHWDRFNKSGQIWARNTLTKRMQGDWILFIDSDHQPEPDMVYRLLKVWLAKGYDVLGGFYQFKEYPHQPMCWMWMPEHNGYSQVAKWDRNVPLIKAGVVGGGCMLISRTAVEKILEAVPGEPFDPIGIYKTDDFDFCERARLAGVDVWWSTTIECPHLMSNRPVTAKDYDRSFVMGKMESAAWESAA